MYKDHGQAELPNFLQSLQKKFQLKIVINGKKVFR